MVTIVAFSVLAAAGLIAGPATPPASAASEVVANGQETPPPAPQGVSPADPSIEPPNMDEWICPHCGRVNDCPKAGYKGRKARFGGPMLAPGQKGRECARGARDQRGMARHGRGMRGSGLRGHGNGVAAERMLRHAPELKLTDDQIGKLEMLAYETKKRMIDLHADVERERLEIKKQMQSGSDDLTQIKRHLSAISKSRLAMQEAKIENLFAARKLLTDEQKEMVKKNHPRMGRILD
jgi:Spy/CpxP family protein refolding chaperone